MSTRSSTWHAGATAGLSGLAAAEALSTLARTPSLIDAAGRFVVDAGPRPLIDIAVRLLRSTDKPVVRGAVGAAAVVGGAAVGTWIRRRGGRIAVLGAASGLGVWLGLRRPPRHPFAVAAAATTGATAAGIILSAKSASRCLNAVGGGAAAALLWWARHEQRRQESRFDAHNQTALAAALPRDPVGVLDAAITPAGSFYTVDVNVGTPRIEPNRWRLRVRGAVDRPLEWTLDQLIQLDLQEFEAVMVCIHNQLGWDRLGNARWLGVPIDHLLAAAGVDGQATTLVTRAVDGYTISLPLDMLQRLPGFVVVGMNGRPLPARHGFPARVFVPGLYGQYTGVKWLTELELLRGPYPDYWAERGWSRLPAPVRPMSRIDSPSHGSHVSHRLRVAGVAWAPPDGIDQVHVSVDDQEWQPAALAPERSRPAWRPWQIDLVLPPGEHRLRSRATSHAGTTQDSEPRPPFPSGVSGYHTISITVSGQRSASR